MSTDTSGSKPTVFRTFPFKGNVKNLVFCCNASKLLETPKTQEYQTNFEKSWWRRVELRYGKNLKDDFKWYLYWFH